MSHSTGGPGVGAALGKFDRSGSIERFWQIFTKVKIRKIKIWGLEELKMLFRFVDEKDKNYHQILFLSDSTVCLF